MVRISHRPKTFLPTLCIISSILDFLKINRVQTISIKKTQLIWRQVWHTIVSTFPPFSAIHWVSCSYCNPWNISLELPIAEILLAGRSPRMRMQTKRKSDWSTQIIFTTECDKHSEFIRLVSKSAVIVATVWNVPTTNQNQLLDHMLGLSTLSHQLFHVQ